jgi:hypothetical protein
MNEYLQSGRKIFLLSVYKKTMLNMKISWRGMELRLSMKLAIVLMLLISGASAIAGAGSVVVDIVGSSTDNTKITASGAEKLELEIIGSTANNTTISLPKEMVKRWHECCIPGLRCGYGLECNKVSKQECKQVSKQESHPWDNLHLGVDAWYGTFWYTDINMPKWPAI